MQHGLRTRLGLFAASMALATAVSADEIQLWREGNDYVRLETVSAANQHPVAFSTEQLTVLLGNFYKRVAKKEPAPYFSQDEISRIAPELVRLFAKAKPGDDVDFGTSYLAGNVYLVPRTLNAGRLFVENGQLNLLIGMCARAQDTAYRKTFGYFRELDHGSRTKPAEKAGCELLAGTNTERVNNRTDWLRLNINAALAATKSVPMFESATPLTFGATASPAATKPAEPATLAKPELPANEAEERLTTLKRLHDQGLITDTEYEQKRAAILKGL